MEEESFSDIMVPPAAVEQVSPAIAAAMRTNNISRIRVAKLLEILKESEKEVTAFRVGEQVYVPSQDSMATVVNIKGDLYRIQLADGTFDMVERDGLELPGQHEEEMQEEKITFGNPVGAKPVPTCKKCGKPHWPFQTDKCTAKGKAPEKGKEEPITTEEVEKISPAIASVMRKRGIKYISAAELEDIFEDEESDEPEFVICGPDMEGMKAGAENEEGTKCSMCGKYPCECIEPEEKEAAKIVEADPGRGQGLGKGGPPQGDRGADVCIGPNGEEKLHTKGTPCSIQYGPGWRGSNTQSKPEKGAAKPVPTCKKCGKPHWPFQKCDQAGKKEPEKPEVTEKEASWDRADDIGAEELLQAMAEVMEDHRILREKLEDAIRRKDERAIASLRAEIDETLKSRRSYVEEYKALRPSSTPPEVTLEDRLKREIPEPVELEKFWEYDNEKEAGKVSWSEFFTDVVPQLSTPQFQTAFESTLNAVPEVTASKEEHNLYQEELDNFRKEASKRGLPNPEDMAYGIGDRVASKEDPDLPGRISEYKLAGKDIYYLLDFNDNSPLWYKEAEITPDMDDNISVTTDGDIMSYTTPEGHRVTKSTEDEWIDEATGEKVLPPTKQAAKSEPTSDTLLTTTPWYDRSHKITEPANAEQHKDFNKELNEKTGSDLKIGSVVKIATDFSTNDPELQSLRDLEVAGPVTSIDGENITITYPEGDLLINAADIEVVSEFINEATIRKCTPSDRNKSKPAEDQVWCLYSKHKPEKVLGRHPSRDKALAQERAIKANASKIVTAEDDIDISPTETVETTEESTQNFEDLMKRSEEIYGEMEKLRPKINMAWEASEAANKAIQDHSWQSLSDNQLDYKEQEDYQGLENAKESAQAEYEAVQDEYARFYEELMGINEQVSALWTNAIPTPAAVEAHQKFAIIMKSAIGEPPGTSVEPASKTKSFTGPPGSMSGDRKRVKKRQNWPEDEKKRTEEEEIKWKETKAARQTLENIYSYMDALLDRVQTGNITVTQAQKEIKSEADQWEWSKDQVKYAKEKLQGKVASLVPPFNIERSPAPDFEISSGGEIARDSAFHGREVVLCYHDGNYKLYNTDYGYITPEGAKEKDIKAQLSSFGLSDDKVTTALKDAKTAEVVIKVGTLFNEKDLRENYRKSVAPSIDIAITAALTQWGPQATRAQLMMTAMDEFAKLEGGADAARIAQKYIKDKLNEELSQYPREEYDGKREFPQSGLTGTKKEARTYSPEEKKKKVKEFSQFGITLDDDIPKKESPWKEEETDYSRNLNAVAFKVGDRVRDAAMPEVTGTIKSFEGDNLVHVDIDISRLVPTGAEGLYMTAGLLKISQLPEFEDAEESEESAEEDNDDLDIWATPKKDEEEV